MQNQAGCAAVAPRGSIHWLHYPITRYTANRRPFNSSRYALSVVIIVIESSCCTHSIYFSMPLFIDSHLNARWLLAREFLSLCVRVFVRRPVIIIKIISPCAKQFAICVHALAGGRASTSFAFQRAVCARREERTACMYFFTLSNKMMERARKRRGLERH